MAGTQTAKNEGAPVEEPAPHLKREPSSGELPPGGEPGRDPHGSRLVFVPLLVLPSAPLTISRRSAASIGQNPSTVVVLPLGLQNGQTVLTRIKHDYTGGKDGACK